MSRLPHWATKIFSKKSTDWWDNTEENGNNTVFHFSLMKLKQQEKQTCVLPRALHVFC